MTQDGDMISSHEALTYSALRSHPNVWLTNGELAEAVEPAGIAARTVRLHTRRFITLGLIDYVRVFPAPMMRWSPETESRNPAYAARLKQALDVLTAQPNRG